GAIRRYDMTSGTSFVAEQSGTTEDLNGIFVDRELGTMTLSIYVVGNNGTILHSSGDGTWTPETSGTTQQLRGVFGTLRSSIYAVGEAGTILHSAGDGTWTSETSGTTQTLRGGLRLIIGAGFSSFVVGDGGSLLTR